ncbi:MULTISPECIES: ABC transporter permease [Rhizobium/Agrobacterium group]|uniref:ABC transporter permease n=1 Tax=Rhizobium rhizogenes TaxID=359 RepID=A0A546X3B9_RHIRH|nr:MULTISPECIES: ABC transporter permease [Rhizobium/Agrobacterium group]TRA95259.1 ABC transporter permease [Rhizobium rhizogenes]
MAKSTSVRSSGVAVSLVTLSAGLVSLFLLAPILAIIPLSFNSSADLRYPIESITLDWYHTVLRPDPWLAALKNSIAIAVPVSLLATLFGTSAAYGLYQLRSKRAALLLTGVFLAPLIVPTVITALALYFFMAKIGLLGSYWAMVLGHTILSVPFVVLMVSVSLRRLDPQLIRAGLSLGGSPSTVGRTIVLPLILPGVLSGAILAFVQSFDEVVVAVFLAGPQQFTLPRQLLSSLQYRLDPSIVAISTLLILATTFLFGFADWLRSRQR